MKEVLNDILSTVKGLGDVLPNLVVDRLEYEIDSSSEDKEIHQILSEFDVSHRNGLIACLDIYLSSSSGTTICIMSVDDYFPSHEGGFEYPKLTSHLTSTILFANEETPEAHHYISKIVPLEQSKEAYVNLLKDIQAFITSLQN